MFYSGSSNMVVILWMLGTAFILGMFQGKNRQSVGMIAAGILGALIVFTILMNFSIHGHWRL